MAQTILLTSFDVWKPHHVSNSSDDLIAELITNNFVDERMHLLRRLPVDFALAPKQVITQVKRLEPEVVVCCGMAEKRSQLTVESNGKYQEEVLQTPVNVEHLVRDLTFTSVSHDAGQFVCNHLYYSLLKHIRDYRLKSQCIFVHVPVINAVNITHVINDFRMILQKLIEQMI